MSSLTLVHPDQTFTVPVRETINNCTLFQKNVLLTASPYRVQPAVPHSVFQEFVSELSGKSVQITTTNLKGLQQLCDEFGFSTFASKLSSFHPSIDFTESEAHNRIAALEEKAKQHTHTIAFLQDRLLRLAREVSTLQTLSGEVSGQDRKRKIRRKCETVSTL
jgi:hypothetical protein